MKKTVVKQRLLIRLMKMTLYQFILALIFSTVTMANSLGQGKLDTKVTVSITDVDLNEALAQLGKSADVKFSYNSRMVAFDQKISVKANNEVLSNVLSRILQPFNIKYTLVSNQIVLQKGSTNNNFSNNVSFLTTEQQQKTLSGVVVDANGLSLPGASVLVKGTNNNVSTDLDGKFNIRVDDGAKVLVISYIGFDTMEIAIGNKTDFKVTLEESSQSLEEVVVIGYGTQKKSDLTGAISSVSGEELATVPAMTAAQALQGRAAGLNIVTTSGAPGAGTNITIRGGTSITQSTKPLYIVDGFQMDDALNVINPNDIKSIEILKDASSTAIYGARGSNGIIVITTKSGKKGKTSVSYNSFISFDKLSKKLDMMSNPEDFVKYQYEMAVLQGKPAAWSNVFDNSLATDTPNFYTGAFDRINSRYASDYAIDWQKRMLGGSGYTQNQNVSVSTGNENTQAFLSYNYNNQEGILANHNDTRNAFRAKINSELYKGLRLDVNTMFTNTSTDGGGAYGGMKDILLQPINGGTLFNQDQTINTQTFGDLSGLDSAYDTENPLIENEASQSNRRSRVFMVNAGVEFDILKSLTWRTSGQYSWSSGKSVAFSDENSRAALTDPVNTGINGSIGNSESFSYQITNTLNYKETFAEKHDVSVLLGQEVTYNESESNNLILRQFPLPNFGLDDISNATVSDKSVGHSRNGLASFFSRLSYTFDDRYLLTATIRTDGSSKFAEGNKWGVFPSLSGAWRISEEGFWKNNNIGNIINNFKLRAGYGITGNNGIGNNLYLTTVSQTDYPINNTPGNPAYVPSSTLGNQGLQWETLHATNLGLDISLFNRRIDITAEWYNNQISDMLLKSIIPSSTGYASQFQNVGTMRNRGWEFTVSTVNVKTSNFSWTTDFNLAFNKSKVLSLEKDQTQRTFNVGNNRSGSVTYYATVGDQLGDMYGYVYQGLYTTDDFTQNSDGTYVLNPGVVKPFSGTASPGDVKFAADNEAGDQFTRQLVKIGNGAPDCLGGITNTFRYKGFDLNTFMKFSIGNEIYNATKHSTSPYALFQNVPTEFGDNYYRLVDPLTGQKATSLSRLQELNPDEASRTSALNLLNSSYITYPSSYFVEDGSYLRLAQITLGYTLPKAWSERAKISNARFYFTANNILTVAGYSGFDPEVSAGDNDLVAVTPGYDSSTYPRSRSFVLGLNLTF
ncbi:TonB-dependent receptor [Flavobacterium sp. FBOR7N2.3]|uniref:TonB-dependent receptor n=1 Tax=Flavobacterium magnesitis TaxID=3138077 RepID=A0ABV4TFX8_9FLAO